MSCPQGPPSARTLIWMPLPGTRQHGCLCSHRAGERARKPWCRVTQGLELHALGSLILLPSIYSPPSSPPSRGPCSHLANRETGVGSFLGTTTPSSQPPYTLTQMEVKLLFYWRARRDTRFLWGWETSHGGSAESFRGTLSSSQCPSIPLVLFSFYISTSNPLSLSVWWRNPLPQNATRPICKGAVVCCPSMGFANSNPSGGSWMLPLDWFFMSPRESSTGSGPQNGSESRCSVSTLVSQSEASWLPNDFPANIPRPTFVFSLRSTQSEIMGARSFPRQHLDPVPQVSITKVCWAKESGALCHGCFRYQEAWSAENNPDTAIRDTWHHLQRLLLTPKLLSG